jgi:dienelactone hydrolase
MKPALKNILAVVGMCSLVATLTACQSEHKTATRDTVTAGGDTPYSVGSSTVFIHDESRPFDAMAGVNFGVRTLITEIWYPVAHTDIDADSVRATYGDYVFGDRGTHRKMLTQTTFFHLTPKSVRDGVSSEDIDLAIDELFTRPRGSYVDAPIATGSQPWPVIVMSHGDAGSRYNMQTVCEHLASHGYIVIAPEHTGNTPFAMIGLDPALDTQTGDASFREQMVDVAPLLDEHGVYGAQFPYGQSYSPLVNGFAAEGFADLDRALIERVNDLRAAIDTLEEMNARGPFAKRMDLSNIGLMGRSFGGATTLAGLMLEDRFISGIAVVPPSLADPRSMLPETMLVGPGQESAVLAAEGSFALSKLHKPTMLLSGGEDNLILGMGLQMAKVAGGTMPNPDNPYPILKAAFDSATVPAIMAIVQNTNHASFGVSGPYWWPGLKPDTFPMFFDNDSQYTLLDSEIAHRVQREMALAFFDLTIRGDQSRLEVLRKNPWGQYDTRIEVRGF